MSDVEQLEHHWLACMASAGGGGRVFRVGSSLVVVNPQVATRVHNFILPRNVSPGDVAALLEAGGALLAGWGRAPALFLSPVAGDSGAVGEALRRLGWRCSVRQVVLACDLPHPGADSPADVNVAVVGQRQFSSWGRVLTEAYEGAPSVGEEVRTAWVGLLRNPGEGAWAQGYLASIGRTPVGTGLLWSQGEVAGLYCGAVLPPYRRRGVERATLLRRLVDARARGASLAVLQTEAGSPVEHLCMERLGFRAAFHRELWLPPSQPAF